MRRFLLRSLVLLSLVAMAASPQVLAQNLLLNGNLDAGTAGGDPDAGGPLPPNPGTNPPWTLTNTGNDTAAQYQGGFADNTGGLGLWYRAFLGGTTPVSSTLSQTTAAPQGGAYLLTFDAVIEQNFTADSLIATLSSSGGGSATLDLLTTKTTNPPYTGGGFNGDLTGYNIQRSIVLGGVNALDTLTVSVAMTGGVPGPGNPQSAVVDNFSLTLIPEPATAVLGALGLIGVICLRRRA